MSASKGLRLVLVRRFAVRCRTLVPGLIKNGLTSVILNLRIRTGDALLLSIFVTLSGMMCESSLMLESIMLDALNPCGSETNASRMGPVKWGDNTAGLKWTVPMVGAKGLIRG